MEGKLLLLVWISVGIVAALPKRKTRYSVDVPVIEEGARFTERISVSEDDIVHISVPQHRDVVASEVILDKQRNITLRYVPSIKSCYLEPSAKVSGENGHKIIMEDLQKADKPSDMPTVTVSRDWTPGFRIFPRSVPDYVKEHCMDVPLYLLKPVHQKRNKRQTARQTCVSPNSFCVLQIKSCHYVPVRDCHPRRLEAIFGDIVADSQFQLLKCNNRQAHVIDKVMCCEPCCEDRASADAEHPHCDMVSPECGKSEEITFEDAVRYTQEMRRRQEEEQTKGIRQASYTTTQRLWGTDQGEVNTEVPGSGSRKLDTDGYDGDDEYDENPGEMPDLE